MASGPPSDGKIPLPESGRGRKKKLSPLGERLKAAWEHAGYTQTALETKLAERGFTSRGYLGRLSRGERGSVSVNPLLLQAITDICGVDYTWLCTGRGSMLPPRTPPMPADPQVTPPPSSVTRGK